MLRTIGSPRIFFMFVRCKLYVVAITVMWLDMPAVVRDVTRPALRKTERLRQLFANI